MKFRLKIEKRRVRRVRRRRNYLLWKRLRLRRIKRARESVVETSELIPKSIR